jgi:hypothetical protein
VSFSVALPSSLRLAALLILLLTLITWGATGFHRGWTLTQITTMEHDEVTGIEYPVTRKGFVAGLDVLGAGVAVAAVLGGASLLARRRVRSGP